MLFYVFSRGIIILHFTVGVTILLCGADAACSVARGHFSRRGIPFPSSDDIVWCTMPATGSVISFTMLIFNCEHVLVL